MMMMSMTTTTEYFNDMISSTVRNEFHILSMGIKEVKIDINTLPIQIIISPYTDGIERDYIFSRNIMFELDRLRDDDVRDIIETLLRYTDNGVYQYVMRLIVRHLPTPLMLPASFRIVILLKYLQDKKEYRIVRDKVLDTYPDILNIVNREMDRRLEIEEQEKRGGLNE